MIFEVISNLSIKNMFYLCNGSIEPGKTIYHWKVVVVVVVVVPSSPG